MNTLKDGQLKIHENSPGFGHSVLKHSNMCQRRWAHNMAARLFLGLDSPFLSTIVFQSTVVYPGFWLVSRKEGSLARMELEASPRLLVPLMLRKTRPKKTVLSLATAEAELRSVTPGSQHATPRAAGKKNKKTHRVTRVARVHNLSGSKTT